MATLIKKRFLAQFVQESQMNGVENSIKEEKSDVLLIDIANNNSDITDEERNNKKLQEKITHDTPLYCVCRRPYDEREFMIGCDGCKNWFHGRCVGITPQQAETIDNYYCGDCLKFSPSMRINGSRKRAIPRPIRTQITATPRKPAECIDRGEDSELKAQLRRSTRLDPSVEKNLTEKLILIHLLLLLRKLERYRLMDIQMEFLIKMELADRLRKNYYYLVILCQKNQNHLA